MAANVAEYAAPTAPFGSVVVVMLRREGVPGSLAARIVKVTLSDATPVRESKTDTEAVPAVWMSAAVIAACN